MPSLSKMPRRRLQPGDRVTLKGADCGSSEVAKGVPRGAVKHGYVVLRWELLGSRCHQVRALVKLPALRKVA